MIENGIAVGKLGLGQSPFPVPEPVVRALIANAAEKDYLPVAGLRELRNAVAVFHRHRDGLSSMADDIVIGPGSKELMFLLQLVCAGDLLIPSPSWVSYAPQADLVGKKTRWIGTSPQNGYRLEPDALASAASDAPAGSILILNYPSNPTGTSYSVAELEALAAVARKCELIVLSDEIYGELHFEGNHASIALQYPEGTIVSAGLSKWCGAGGWRLGTFAFPAELADVRRALVAAASETFTSVSAPIQYAAITAFTPSVEIDAYLDRSRAVLKGLATWSVETLAAAGVTCPMPEGGFYLFADFSAHREALAKRGITTSSALCDAVLEEARVAFLPGNAFGRAGDELTARLAFVDFDGAEALKGDDAIDDAFLRARCPRVIAAVESIVDWLAS